MFCWDDYKDFWRKDQKEIIDSKKDEKSEGLFVNCINYSDYSNIEEGNVSSFMGEFNIEESNIEEGNVSNFMEEFNIKWMI